LIRTITFALIKKRNLTDIKQYFNMAENNTPPNELNTPHDTYFKGVMGMKTVAIDFNKQFLPKSILELLDLDTLELDTVSYITDELKQNFADVVWKRNFKKGGRQARIALVYEHKSYIEKYPHFQLLRYIQGAWDTQIKQHKMPFMTIPLVMYHGQEKWKQGSFDSSFGVIDPELLRFLPCFDYVLINLQKYSDATIRKIESIFLQKSLLAFKHFWNKVYLKLNFVELLFRGLNENNDETRSFLNKLGVYLSNISELTKSEIIELVNKSDHNLKHQAMSIFEELIEEGLQKGIEKGIEKAMKVIKLWQQGVKPTLIANMVGLSIEQVNKVISDFESKT
jgi:predicted transposase/invertase (TIGR01784 family)